MTFFAHEKAYSIFSAANRKRLQPFLVATAARFWRETDA